MPGAAVPSGVRGAGAWDERNGAERGKEFDGDAETIVGVTLDAGDAGQVFESEAAVGRRRQAGDDEVHAFAVGGAPGAEVEAADGDVDGGAEFFKVGAETVTRAGADGLRDGHATRATPVGARGRGRGSGEGGVEFGHGGRP